MLHRTSRLFWPVLVTPKNTTPKIVDTISRSQKLMTELGLIKPASNGTFQIMPLAQRVLDKCVELVDRRMQAVDGQKISLPVLTAASLWKQSGRLKGDITEFYVIHDRHGKEFLLSPTHEEAITSMLAAAAPISYRQLPLRLYQIGPKFRDELKSRFGLMRAKEFLMKDMYTFDRSSDEARQTYEQLIEAYEKFFQQLEVPFSKVEASTGIMGGSRSHEFHYISTAGEDRLLHCHSCGHAYNIEVTGELNICPHCAEPGVTEMRGIEVAHAFILEDKYTRPLGATFLNANGKPQPLLMGCFGIGVSRLIAAVLEVLSSDTELRWPTLLAPFDVVLIGPKLGSKESQVGDALENELCTALQNICGRDEVLHDDRKYLTIGKRLMDAKRLGIPSIVVVGAKCLQDAPLLELHMGDEIIELDLNEVLQKLNARRERKQQLLNQ